MPFNLQQIPFVSLDIIRITLAAENRNKRVVITYRLRIYLQIYKMIVLPQIKTSPSEESLVKIQANA